MIRKIFTLLPQDFQEQLKLLYYNARNRDFVFSKETGLYRTEVENSFSILTGSPLYFIVKDIKRYEKFYNVTEGDIVLDAGANEGILTLIYSKKVDEKGKVYAFEPDEKNIIVLKKNFSLNCGTGNIDLQQRGLWSRKREISFYEAGTVGSSIFYQAKDAVKKDIEVISIDEFVTEQKIVKLDFIKIDVEGAEIEVLSGAIHTLRNLEPNLAIATYHLVDGEHTFKKVEAFLKRVNYPFRTEFYEDGEIITYAGPQIKGA